MFTGIIEEVGRVHSINKSQNLFKIVIEANFVLKDSKIGDSISINGTCLTITSINGDLFSSDIVRETIEKTSLKYTKIGDQVNLERAMRADSRFDGHIVQGHIEGVGRVKSIQNDKESFIVKIEIEHMACVIFKHFVNFFKDV